jgi:hypothetical protein
VNTTEWDVVLRPGDGEPVGYLVPEDGLAVPVSLVGTPLGPAATHADATALLLAHGLPALDRRWWCRLPDPLPRGVLDAGEPEPAWAWRAVVLVEVSRTECRVRPEWPSPDEVTGRAVLPVPVADLLRADPP